MEKKKQMCDKQMFAGPVRDHGTQRTLENRFCQVLTRSTHLVHIAVIYHDTSLPRIGPLSALF